jgi:protein lifeguard
MRFSKVEQLTGFEASWALNISYRLFTKLWIMIFAVVNQVWVLIQISNPSAVLLAAGITTVIVGGLTVYALQTKYDFTTHGGILMGALLALIIVGFVGIFLPHMKVIELVFSGVGALVFSAFLVVDVQMLMDGRRVQISPDDYILGALNLYLDILNLFLYILRFINAARN